MKTLAMRQARPAAISRLITTLATRMRRARRAETEAGGLIATAARSHIVRGATTVDMPTAAGSALCHGARAQTRPPPTEPFLTDFAVACA